MMCWLNFSTPKLRHFNNQDTLQAHYNYQFIFGSRYSTRLKPGLMQTLEDTFISQTLISLARLCRWIFNWGIRENSASQVRL